MIWQIQFFPVCTHFAVVLRSTTTRTPAPNGLAIGARSRRLLHAGIRGRDHLGDRADREFSPPGTIAWHGQCGLAASGFKRTNPSEFATGTGETNQSPAPDGRTVLAVGTASRLPLCIIQHVRAVEKRILRFR